ncbi:MAG: multicopper oxidase domain-containing protein [Wenzhouxiangellaceae bacterium]
MIIPEAHQRFDEFPPEKFHIERMGEGRWQYHPDGAYSEAGGSWHYGWHLGENPHAPSFITPGATYRAFYDEPIFVRRINEAPPLGSGNVKFALPSFTVHLHNAHTASESDGFPADYFDPGTFWDHHYPNILAGYDQYGNGGDPRETLTTLWYHDHRLDFTATNVYAGISGVYHLYDDFDKNDETDPQGSRLPSGEYDIPLMLHDVQFAEDEQGQAQVVWDFFTPSTQDTGEGTIDDYAPRPSDSHFPSFQHTTFGMIGDQYTVNRVIRPYHDVKRRKYRFRIVNGGPSRLYDLTFERETESGEYKGPVDFTVITNDGNFLDEPMTTKNIELWVANRSDVIIDFSEFDPGDKIYMVNHLEMIPSGEGPTGRYMPTRDENKMLQFRVQPGVVHDPSRVPNKFRSQPDIDFTEVRRERLFTFDYDNGLFTIDGKLMDANRVDAAIEKGSAEIWTLRNEGVSWGHPIHTHFEEFQIFEINGQPIEPMSFKDAKKDVVQLKPGHEIKLFGRWRDFLGKYVMHCHNVVHEDHAMMIRWDIVNEGEGD